MENTKKYLQQALGDTKTTCRPKGNLFQFSILYLLLSGLIQFARKDAETLMQDLTDFGYYTVLPILGAVVVVFIWHWIRSPLKVQLNETKPSPSIHPLTVTSYQKAVGILFDLLERYNWKEMRDITSNFPFSSSTRWYDAYKKLDDLRIASIGDKKLRTLLNNFLANFKAWESSFVLPQTSIKPSFESKKHYLKEKKKIEKTAAELQAYLSKHEDLIAPPELNKTTVGGKI